MTSSHRALSRRNFLRLAGGATGALMLAACGVAQNNQAATLNQWYHQYGEAGTKDAANRYAANYDKSSHDTQINVGWIGGDYSGTLGPALLSPNGPDLFENSALNLDWINLGLLEPLDDLFPDTVRRDFDQAALKQFSFNGHVYGIKMVGDPQMLFYRKSMLARAGIDPASITTFDALSAAAQRLTTGNVKGLYLGIDGGISALNQVLVWSTGGDLLDSNQITFATPRTIAAATKLRDLNASGHLMLYQNTPADQQKDWYDPTNFLQGLCAIAWGGMWGIPKISAAIGDDFGVMPWPALDAQGTPAMSNGGWAAMVNARGPHIDQAKALVKSLWLDDTTVQEDWNLSYGFHIPSRLSLATSATKIKSGVAAEVVALNATYARFTSPIWSSSMGTALTNALTNIIVQHADPTTEIQQAAQACQTLLKVQGS